MISLRDSCTGLRPVHFFQKLGRVVAGLLFAAGPLVPTPASAAPAVVAGMGVGEFYTARQGAPLWFSANSGYAAQAFLELLKQAKIDGLDTDRYGLDPLTKAVAEAAGGDRKAVQRADAMLSQAFVAYVSDLRQQPDLGIIYVDPQLHPVMPSARAILTQAGTASSLESYIRTMGWMHPLYGQLRQALVDQRYADDHQRELLQLNLERARALPTGKGRYIIVNAAEQRLYMWEDGKPVDSMVVVVGKPKYPTPLMAAYIRFAALNPYWYVPPDLAGEDVAQFVLKQGLPYLKKMGYEVVSDWTPNPTVIDPKTIDWKGVNDGKVDVMIRQKPGPQNFMGRMKFMFPNSFGVYLHDNPRRELFLKSARYFSGGCVRLEDAARLGRWLFGRDLDWQSAGIEQPVPLNPPVPVYITYLTAMPSGPSIAYFDDVYGRDKARLASIAGPTGDAVAAK